MKIRVNHVSESDIRGGNCYKSHFGISWSTILVRTGVYPAGGVPAWEPSQTVSDVFEAVQWALAEQHGHHPSVRKN
jgi:ribonucleotide monophosphatase NagD (HAD superfamily)